jgi:hypothetical protein
MSDEIELTEVFSLVVTLCHALGVVNIKDLPGAWEYRIDDQWEIAVNGHREAIEIPNDGSRRMGCTIPPFESAIWFNGWLAGLMSPFDGILAGGEACNEAALIDALHKAIDRANEGKPEPL